MKAFIKFYLTLPLVLPALFSSCVQQSPSEKVQSSGIQSIEKSAGATSLQVTSTAFSTGGMIPSQYTCDGANVNPPLDIQGIPEQAKSLALIVDDPDAPSGTWVHWVVWNIPVTEFIEENTVPGKEGLNDFKKHHYGGPCPPSGTHRYFFKVYALDALLDLPDNTKKAGLEKAMEGHIVASGELMGVYKRKH